MAAASSEGNLVQVSFPFPLTSPKLSGWDILWYLPSYCFPCSKGLHSSTGSAGGEASQSVKYKWRQSRYPRAWHHSQSIKKGTALHLGFGTSAFPFVPDRNRGGARGKPTKKSPQFSRKYNKKDFSLTEAFCVNFDFLVNNMLHR